MRAPTINHPLSGQEEEKAARKMSLNLLLITACQRNGPVKSQAIASPRFLIKQTSCLHLAVSSLELLLFTPSLSLVLFRCYFLNRVGGAAL